MEIGHTRHRRIAFVVVAAVIAVGFGTGCRRPPNASSGVRVGFQIEPKPLKVGIAIVSFELTDAASRPVNGAKIAVEADMSHAGMSPVFAQANEVQPGLYQSHLSLGMAGDWVILLHGTLPDGEKFERQFDVRDVQPN
jgi:YtkA-like